MDPLQQRLDADDHPGAPILAETCLALALNAKGSQISNMTIRQKQIVDLSRAANMYLRLRGQSSSPQASPKAIRPSWSNKNLLSSDLSHYGISPLMSFRVYFQRLLTVHYWVPDSGALRSDFVWQAMLTFSRAVWLIWLIFTAVTPGTNLPYLVVIIPHTYI